MLPRATDSILPAPEPAALSAQHANQRTEQATLPPEQAALPLLAFYGGSFNPVHYGHLNTARYLAQLLPASRIIFLPNSSPPHKDTAKLSYDARRAMLAAAIKECLSECDVHGKSRYDICDLESDASTRHYTIDTLTKLKALYPQHPLAFIMGWDSLITLDQWKQGLELHQLAQLIVLKRPGLSDLSIPPAVQASMAQNPEHYRIVANPEFEVSSSAIRAQIAHHSAQPTRGEPGTELGAKPRAEPYPELSALMPLSVRTLIAQHGYYR